MMWAGSWAKWQMVTWPLDTSPSIDTACSIVPWDKAWAPEDTLSALVSTWLATWEIFGRLGDLNLSADGELEAFYGRSDEIGMIAQTTHRN